ncbi:MAG: hypothetical protein H8E14_13465 [Candidatus Marinimicrobia bacterium]|nr:hypothetical protein [Candidatus Neomarinimicrobiota bacterium]
MNLKKTILLLLLLLTSTLAWYPDYSVMVTDFVLPRDYLAPCRIQSIGLQALGNQFQRLYDHPLDNAFQNPAYLGQQEDNYLYLDVAGDETDYYKEDIFPVYGGAYMDMDYSKINPYYWSPYRVMETPEEDQPIARLIYLGKPLKILPLRLGTTFEYFYDRELFYQPYWYGWGWRNMDAMGAAYDEMIADPYDDYRIVESGENLQDEQGYRINTFISMPILPFLTLGARLTIQNKQIDGDYSDLDLRDDNYWADEYLNYYDVVKTRDQEFGQNDLALGALLQLGARVRLGVSVGYATGDIDRRLVETDTSKHYSRYYNHPDTSKINLYNSTGAYASTKQWLYDGHTRYCELHGDIEINPDVTLRWSTYYESREADLTESEVMWRRSEHSSHYWSHWDSVYHDYENISRTSLDRTGSGEYRFENWRFSIGANWQMSPAIRFSGGLVYDRQLDSKDAVEPFIGSKYSYYSNDWSYNYSSETTRNDDKQFSWQREETYVTLALPTGVIVELGDALELSLGLTKLIRSTDITEGYDLVVFNEETIKRIDGTVITDSDSAYVDGHKFPGVHTFIDEYRMNAGISFKYKDSFKITAALAESILEPRSFKIGAEFRW